MGSEMCIRDRNRFLRLSVFDLDFLFLKTDFLQPDKMGPHTPVPPMFQLMFTFYNFIGIRMERPFVIPVPVTRNKLPKLFVTPSAVVYPF